MLDRAKGRYSGAWICDWQLSEAVPGKAGSFKTSRVLTFLCVAFFALGGCGLLPHDGPSVNAVEQGAKGTRGGYSLVELNARTGAIIGSVPQTALLGLANASSTDRVDLIGVGDSLSVTILDHGQDALFGNSAMTQALDRVAAGSIPKILVDGQGNVDVPYAGQVHVAGLTTTQASQVIAVALKGKAVNPQVVVTIADNVANSVSVVGEVHTPGRYPLFEGGNHILDVLAAAAGATRSPGDIRVVVSRGSTSASVPLTQLLSDGSQNIRLAPRDLVRLVYAPRKINTFGALGHDSVIPIEDETMSLASALSQSGGLDPGTANASSVYLFRFERPQVASALNVRAPVSAKGVPIVYHLNMRKADEMFVATQFEMQSNDLIYVPRSNLAEMQQFINLVSAASSVAYNIRVTTAVVP